MKDEEAQIETKFRLLQARMDERMRRLWAASEAEVLGHGGISMVSRATGITRPTIVIGMQELRQKEAQQESEKNYRIRRPGAGRPALTEQNPALMTALEALVEPTTRGDPQSMLRWTCKSVRVLASELQRQGHQVSRQTVCELLQAAGYSLQANRKTLEGASHPDRNAQFEHIASKCKEYQERNQPVISVDTKKKELVGAFKNGGREWQPQGSPVAVRVHDFQDPELGKAIPYGVYDLSANAGWVSVGIDHDTPAFAVASIKRWWEQMGNKTYPQANELLITADGGGSNGSRARLWKLELQRLADATGLSIAVCHFPPGTSKWNKIEHRMFCHMTQNWRGRPLTSYEVIVNLIANTTTSKGLRIETSIDSGAYPTGIKVSDEDLAGINLTRHTFCGNWNYEITPRLPPPETEETG